MNKNKQPVISPIKMDCLIKSSKTYESSSEDTNPLELTVIYLAGGRGWA